MIGSKQAIKVNEDDDYAVIVDTADRDISSWTFDIFYFLKTNMDNFNINVNPNEISLLSIKHQFI